MLVTSNISHDVRFLSVYRKVPKFSDTRKLSCNLPKIQIKRQNLFRLKDANEMVCTVCSDLFVKKLWIITVYCSIYIVFFFALFSQMSCYIYAST